MNDAVAARIAAELTRAEWLTKVEAEHGVKRERRPTITRPVRWQELPIDPLPAIGVLLAWSRWQYGPIVVASSLQIRSGKKDGTPSIPHFALNIWRLRRPAKPNDVRKALRDFRLGNAHEVVEEGGSSRFFVLPVELAQQRGGFGV